MMDDFERFKNLMVMALADGKLTDEELTFLSLRCARWGLGEEQFAEAIEFARGADVSIAMPADKAERVEILKDQIRMMAVDGELSEAEKQLFAIVAATMNVGSEELDQLIDSLLSTDGK